MEQNNNNNKFKNFLCSKLGKAGMIIIMYGIVLLLTIGIVTAMDKGTSNFSDYFGMFAGICSLAIHKIENKYKKPL